MKRLASVIFMMVGALALTVPGQRGPERVVHASMLTAAPAPELGRVRYIYRGLSVQPPHLKRQQGKVRMPLFDQYALRTGAGEKASVRFRDGTILHLNQNTDAALQSSGTTYVSRGEVAEIHAPGTHDRIVTATAVAAAVGSKYLVQVQERKATFIVLVGAVQVQSKVNDHLVSVVVKSNQETVSVLDKAPTKPQQVDAKAAFAWTDSIPTPELGEDIALDANGGRVLAASSQRGESGSLWDVSHISDGLLSEGWESAKGKVTNQWVKLSFHGPYPYRIIAVIIDPAATHGGSSSEDMKDFEIRASATGAAQTDFVRVFRGRTKPTNTLQLFRLPAPVSAKYLELYALNNHGSNQHLAVAELEVVADVAAFAYPHGIAVAPSGDVYVSDTGNDRIEKLSPRGRVLAVWGTKGSGPGQLKSPMGITVDRRGNVYVADTYNYRIQEFSPAGKLLAQWGSAGIWAGRFKLPSDVAVDGRGTIYVADEGNNRILKLSPHGALLDQWARLCVRSTCNLAVAVDRHDNAYIAEQGAPGQILKLSPDGETVATWRTHAGSSAFDGVLQGIAVDLRGQVYVTDYDQCLLEKLSSRGKTIGLYHFPGLICPQGVSVDRRGRVYTTDPDENRVLQIAPTGKLLAAWGLFGAAPHILGAPAALSLDRKGNVYVTDYRLNRVQERTPSGQVLAVWGRRGTVKGSPRSQLGRFDFFLIGSSGIAVDGKGNIYVNDSTNRRVQKLSPLGPIAALLPGIASGGVAIDTHDNVYLSDSSDKANPRIDKLSPAGKVIARYKTTTPDPKTPYDPQALAVDADGNIYALEARATVSPDYRVEKLSATGRSLARWGTFGYEKPGQFFDPGGIAVDNTGDVYVSDTFNNRVQKFSSSGQLITAWGREGSRPGQFLTPMGIAVDAHGIVYVADQGNLRIQRFSADGAYLDMSE